MFVLHVSTSDISGGASIAAYRLHQALLQKSINSNILTGFKKSHDKTILQISKKHYIKKVFSYLSGSVGLHYVFIPDTWKISSKEIFNKANILNFHNLHGGYFNYLALPLLTQHLPAVYTLHDMWSFTGHCAYSFDCDRWQVGCGSCPNLNTYPAVKFDNTKLEWRLKKWVYSNSNLTIVTPSQWLKQEAEKSMLGDKDIYCIPNGVPTNILKPIDSHLARTVLGLPQDKFVLAFAAHSFKDVRKGADLLLLALQKIPQSFTRDLLIVTLGSQSERFLQEIDIPSLSLGYIEGDVIKAIFYSAADLFICPTRADNFPLVLQESMSCATPLVSFDVGGISDLVRPGITGYLAKPEDPQDLCNGIVSLLEDKALRKEMGYNCRRIAETEYSLELQAQRYIKLYQQILGK